MPFEIKTTTPLCAFSGFSESGFVSPENIFHQAIFFPARMLASYLPLHNSTAPS
jgi:hypothetical protein